MKFTTTLLILLFVTLLAPLSAQQAPERNESATVHAASASKNTADVGPITTFTFEEGTTYGFGTVKEGEIVTKVFTFTNTGTEYLIISDAKGSCGCTVPARPSAPIAPGETAAITVAFNSRNKRGMRNQKVTITANTEPAQTSIYLTGIVTPDPDNEFNAGGFEIVEPEPAEKEIPKGCFAIYPNPTAEVLKLRMDEGNFGKSADVAIYSLSGQLMAHRKVPSIGSDVEFDVAHYPAGTYHARVVVGYGKPVSQCFVVVD